jgi:DNA-binding transcriptional LysR family regulator
MDIKTADLNLLYIFEVMLQQRSVTRTAEVIGLSQPATSGAIARLRLMFDDPLFVKSGQEMKPTARAMALAEPVRLVMETVKSRILQDSTFDPAVSTRTFTVLMPDIAEMAFIPRVFSYLAEHAPQVDLRARSIPPSEASAVLEAGEAELAVGFFPDLQTTGFFQQRLFKTSYVCIACAQNTSASMRISLKEFLLADHVVVRPEGREHLFEGFLRQRRLSRRVALEVSHFMSLIAILPGTRLLAVVPVQVADAIAEHIAIKRSVIPLKAPQIDVLQFWHQRFHKDPGNVWFRDIVRKLYQR